MVYVFHSIHNFRDLADSVQRRSKVCSRSIFRSATLDFATEEDLEKLIEELNVTTILDLRSEIEAQLSKTCKPFVSFPVATTALKIKPTDLTDQNPEPSVKEKSDGNGRKTIMINFAGQKFRKFAVWKAAPLKTKMQIVGLVASGQKPKAVKLVGEEIIARKGLFGLYKDFIDYCDQEICEALQVLSNTDNYPILVHCTQGKDRTGLVTALALAAAGIDETHIIEDYAKSQVGLAPVRDHMVKEMQKDGLDSSFADAPPEVMMKTFDYIREKYTNVEGYLDYIGFRKQDREGLTKALTFKAMQMEIQRSPQPVTGASRPHHRRSHTVDQTEGITKRKSKEHKDRKEKEKEKDNKEGEKKESLSPWSKDKPREIARSLGIPIGWRRRSESEGPARDDNNNNNNNDSDDGDYELEDMLNDRPVSEWSKPEKTGKYISAHPRAGVELMSSGMGLNLCSHRSPSKDALSSSSPAFSSPSFTSPDSKSNDRQSHQRALSSDDTTDSNSTISPQPQSPSSLSSSSSFSSPISPIQKSSSIDELISSDN